MQTTASLLHLTLNTGHRALTAGLTPPEELAAVRPLLQRGGPIPTRPPYRVDLNRPPGVPAFASIAGSCPSQ
jgi:hypothetical protein